MQRFAARIRAHVAERGSVSIAAVAGLAALTVLAFRGLIDYAQRGAPVGTPDLDEADSLLFGPFESSPELVYPVFVWMLYRRRRELRTLLKSAGAIAPAFLLLVAASGLAIWAYYIEAQPLLIPALSLMLLGGGWLLGGRAAARCLLVPALFLFFARPPPGVLVNAVIFPLQIQTAQLSGFVLSVLGQPFSLSGDMIFRPGQAFQVIETCSGLRSMETLVMTTFVYVELFERSGRRLAFLALLALPVGLLLNGLRVVAIILGHDSKVVSSHLVQGLVAIVVGVLAICAIDRALDFLSGKKQETVPAQRAPQPPTGLDRFHPARWIALATLLAVIAVCATWMPRWSPTPEIRARLFTRVPATLSGWNAELAALDRVFLGTVHFSDELYWTYRNGIEEVSLFISEDNRIHPVRSQTSPKTALLSSGWSVADRWRVELAEVGAREVDALLLRAPGGRHLLVFHWHEETAPFPVELMRDVLALDRSPLRRREPARTVRIATPTVDTPEGMRIAEARLRDFLGLLAKTPFRDGAHPG